MTGAAAVAVVDVVAAALVVVLAIVVLVEVVVVVAAVFALVVVVRRAAFFTLASEEEEEELDPQADTRTSPERTKQESRRFCIPLLCIMYTINTTHLDAEYLMVREGGLEPPRPYEHWHLKPARLPFRHSRE